MTDYHDIPVDALMVVGPGEADRWLQSNLEHLATVCDRIFVFTDRLPDDDNFFELVPTLAARPQFTVRGLPDDAPTFLEHEGRFRQIAWDSYELALEPHDGRWLFVVDADEFPVSRQRLVSNREAMQASAGFAEVNGLEVVGVPVHEVWGQVNGTTWPMLRNDGKWAHGIAHPGPRLVRWRPGLTFHDRHMGCGSVPAEFYGLTAGLCFFDLLHYGYATLEDVAAKAARYQGMADHGHDPEHVASITKPPRVAPYGGQVEPNVWRGIR